jgi:hypothetical protein
MIKRTLIVSIFSFLLFFACSTKKSRVISFEYGGHFDTSCAILEGEVYEPYLNTAAKDSLFAVTNAMIKAVDSSSNMVYKTAYTDSRGKFSMSFFTNNTYNLVITKSGYQTIRITNFIADTGQTSKMKLILEKEQKIF